MRGGIAHGDHGTAAGVKLCRLAARAHFLIWAISNRQIALDQHDAEVIFAPGEEGHLDSPDAARSVPQRHYFDTVTTGIDRISARPVTILLVAATIWLLIGSTFGLIASLKLHWPDWLSAYGPLTFGRVHTLHLNLVIYGWLSQIGIASMIWILPRILHTQLRAPRLPIVGAILWNVAVALGALAIANGWTDGEEWLEIPWQLDMLLALAGVFFVIPLVKTTRAREVHHIYVSDGISSPASSGSPVSSSSPTSPTSIQASRKLLSTGGSPTMSSGCG